MASPVSTTESNLDNLLNELLRSADDWAGLRTDLLGEEGNSRGEGWSLIFVDRDHIREVGRNCDEDNQIWSKDDL